MFLLRSGGPKGTGALVIRGDVPLEPLVEGGGQELGLRAGTSNVAGAVAMAAALEACAANREADGARIAVLRDRLLDGLLSVPGACENGDRARKVAGNAHVSFEGVEAEALLDRVKESLPDLKTAEEYVPEMLRLHSAR